MDRHRRRLRRKNFLKRQIHRRLHSIQERLWIDAHENDQGQNRREDKNFPAV
jgi:hypothetical protein